MRGHLRESRLCCSVGHCMGMRGNVECVVGSGGTGFWEVYVEKYEESNQGSI